MTSSVYSHIGTAFRNVDPHALQTRLIAWRASESIVVVDKPLRLDRARALGYKAKQGFVVVRVRLKRGGRTRSRHKHGRKSTKQHVRKTLKMNYQWVAEIRASRHYKNLEVLNSYLIGKDGKYYFYEVIMIDPSSTSIMSDPTYKWVSESHNRKRAERGITSAARKSRGLRGKSHTLRVRPSLRSWKRTGK